MNNTKVLLGARIREIRKARGFTQEQLAEMIDVEQKHVSRIESGKNFPTINRLEKIAAALNVPLMEFFDFMHLKDDDESAVNLEKMFLELDKNSRKIAFRLIRATIKALKDI
ncbi:MAG TPA: helix-turn-helix transcriptional regulator [Geobacteraceae bacterium]|nr:helix-turn-helix transcriptional regulator [Geobacteraceae bacterium]